MWSGLLLAWLLGGCRFAAEEAPAPASPLPASARSFPVDDQVVSDPRAGLSDPEFHPETRKVTWEERFGEVLWVCDLDPQTGALVPPDCKGAGVDTAVNGMANGHGPEWVLTAEGPQIVYSRWNGTEQLHLTRAWQEGTSWVTELLLPDRPDSMGPQGSKDPGDPAPRIVYFDRANDNQARWRFLDGTADGVVPDDPDFAHLFRVPRWVPGTHEVIFSRGNEVLTANIDTGTYEVLVQTGPTGPVWMWDSPSRGDKMFHVAVGDPWSRLEVYARIEGRWQRVKTIEMPADHPYVFSPEAFEHEGKVYISYVAAEAPRKGPWVDSEVWIAGAEPGNDVLRRVSGPGRLQRADPEMVALPGGVFLYYTAVRADRAGNVRAVIHRCATGL